MRTHFFYYCFFWKKYNFMHFERHFESHFALPFKMYKILYFSRKPEKILGFTSKFRYGRITLNTDIFYLASLKSTMSDGQKIAVCSFPSIAHISAKVKYHQILVTMMLISKIFIPNFVYVLTIERYQTYQTGFLFCHLGYAPGVGLWGSRDAEGVKKDFKHGHVAYQISRDDKQNKMQAKFSS